MSRPSREVPAVPAGAPASKGPKRAPAFQFYAAAWLGSTLVELMPPEVEGTYIRLLARQWMLYVSGRDQVLPTDPADVRRLTKLSPAQWAKAWPLLEEHFPLCDGGRANPTLCDIWEGRVGFVTKQRENGAKGGRPRGSGGGGSKAPPRRRWSVDDSPRSEVGFHAAPRGDRGAIGETQTKPNAEPKRNPTVNPTQNPTHNPNESSVVCGLIPSPDGSGMGFVSQTADAPIGGVAVLEASPPMDTAAPIGGRVPPQDATTTQVERWEAALRREAEPAELLALDAVLEGRSARGRAMTLVGLLSAAKGRNPVVAGTPKRRAELRDILRSLVEFAQATADDAPGTPLSVPLWCGYVKRVMDRRAVTVPIVTADDAAQEPSRRMPATPIAEPAPEVWADETPEQAAARKARTARIFAKIRETLRPALKRDVARGALDDGPAAGRGSDAAASGGTDA